MWVQIPVHLREAKIFPKINENPRRTIAFFEKMWYNRITIFILRNFHTGRISVMLDWLEKTWNTIYGVISQTVLSTFPFLNIILVIMAGCFGSMLFGKIKAPVRDALLKTVGIIAMLMGASVAWDGFFVLQTGQFETKGTILVVFALLLGYVFGDALAVDRLFDKLGAKLSGLFTKKTPPAQAKDPKTPAPAEIPVAGTLQKGKPVGNEGFVLATVMCAFSAPNIRYAIESQLNEEAVPLLIKIGFDILVIFLLAAIFGSDVTYAAAPILVVEGVLILITKLWGDLLTPALIGQITLVGAVILIATGLGLGLGKKYRTANLIPALFIPVVYGLIMLLAEKAFEAE